jgi:signal transduction histidine kinase
MVRRSQVREIVHDMRQPLAVIAALVGAAEVRADLPSDVRLGLEQIKGQVENLTELCHRMLDGSGPRLPLAVDRLVADVVGDAEIAHARPIELVTSHATVIGDDVSLRRAVWNLLENACRAAGPHWVRVSVAESQGEVRIEVSDGGPGFTNGPPGTSCLGLAIVDSVVRHHGGRVDVDLTNRVGAAVTIFMPVAEAHANVGAAEQRSTLRLDAVREGEWCPAS